MVEIFPLISDKVIAIEVDGKIEKIDVDRLVKVIDDKLKHHSQLNIFVEMKSFSGIALDALVEELKFALSHFKKFGKKAIVSDKTWIEKAVVISDKLFPSIEVQSFAPEEREKAIEWLAE
ncbi:STAS/SEC14 domain-containing protein [Spartinivicinus poritis]|uniref:STAS/SEC14 domain-containing protein n=1 Tax=Spartinivicinus poritis TaxID=2994640 RepID=A0ABT5UFY7_9GAMM|nr:STAS/SEC14 domain-containing protein [Spartinivicinus sp. A2-2]MDE1465292.1 STAS/SEC14 domain-containing protein [Spartinivicinus sp. A2-2]